MVFESIFAYFLDKYLSSYIDNFDGSKLKIGIWNGDVVLENLYLKSNALDELNLPIKVVFGHLKKLTLKIPWKSLYYESVKVSIDGLTILAAPKSSVLYNAESEKKELRDIKLQELKKLIELEKSKSSETQSEENPNGEKQDTFTERLQMQIMRNLELHIANIHIRYEDDFSKPEHPFSAGFTLNSIEIKTADENWNPTYLKNDKILINKLVSLLSLAIYCNSEEQLLKEQSRETMIPKLQNMISNDCTSMRYILDPMSLETKALLNMKPKLDNFQTPMFDITILLESIGINLNRLQYFDIIDMLGTIDTMSLNAKYHKYKPLVPLKTSIEAWWKFAYEAIADTQIRPRIKQFKWENIKLITQTRRDYVSLLIKKLKKGAKLTQDELDKEIKYEEILDVFNLALARKQAEVENKRIKEETAKSSWWGWATSSSVPKDDKDKISEAVDLSKEEKAKLFDAIGYTEEKSYSEYPVEYINWRIKFLLRKFEVSLKNGEYKTSDANYFISNKNLLHLNLENMELNFYKRPVNDGFKATSSIKSILVTGSSVSSLIDTTSSDEEPILIEPERKDQDFMNLEYEQNPLNALGNKRIVLRSKSLRMTYHAVTINNIVYFFRSSQSKITVPNSKLKTAALKKISQAKERSILFMKNNLQYVQQIDLNIDVQPSYLIIPENGSYKENSRALCINFGHFSMNSESNFNTSPTKTSITSRPKSVGDDDDESFYSADEDSNSLIKSLQSMTPLNQEEADIITASYYKFQIDLKNMQILLIDDKKAFDEFKSSLNQKNVDKSLKKYYILTPLDYIVRIHQCIYSDDIKMPAWKVFGSLPLISTELSNKKIERIIQLAASIPLPQASTIIAAESIYEDLIDEDTASAGIISDLNILEPSLSQSKSSYMIPENFQQAINLELSFEIKEIFLKIVEDTEDSVKYFDYISFKISSFGTCMQMKTYDNHVNVYLDYVECEYGLLKDIDGSKLFLLSSRRTRNESQKLVDIDIMQTYAQSPTLVLMHNNILTKVDVKMSSVDFVLNLIALRNMMRFIDIFQKNLDYSKTLALNEKVIGQKESDTSKFPHLNEEQISHFVSKTKKIYKKNRAKGIITSNLIELQLNAKLDGVKARLTTAHSNYFQFNVNNFQLNVENRISEKNIAIVLNSISVLDMQANATYEQIVSLKENTDNLIDVNLTMFNAPKDADASKIADMFQNEKFYFKNYLNEEYFDLVVKANISKLRLMFVYKHLDTLLSLLRIISDSSSPSKQLEHLSKETVNESLHQIEKFSFLYRVKLDVTVNAPIIIIPYKEHAILLDCGLITVQSNLEIIDNYFETKQVELNPSIINHRCKIPPLIEIQRVTLSEMEISRAAIGKDLTIESEISLVECSDLKVTVRRNFQPNVYTNIELININSYYNGLLVSLSRSDYTFLLELLQSLGQKEKVIDPDLNFNEPPKQVKQSKPTDGNHSKVQHNFKNENERIIIKFDVASIKMFLHDKETVLTKGKVNRSRIEAFSKMELNTLKFELNIENETLDTRNSIRTIFLLDNIILDDTRPCNKKPIRLVERYNLKQVVEKPMIYCSFESKLVRTLDENDEAYFLPESRLNTTLSCLRMCVNVDYLLLLHFFFVDGLPKEDHEIIRLKEDELMNEIELGQTANDKNSKEDEADKRFFCDIRIENPQFILYENQFELSKTNCLIIDGLIFLKITTFERKTKLYFTLTDFMMKLRSFKKKTYETRNSYLILSPMSMSLTGIIENDEKKFLESTNPDKRLQSFICDFQEINLNMCPLMLDTSLKMMNSIQNSISNHFGELDLNEKKEIITSTTTSALFTPTAFEKSYFWFTQPKNKRLLSGSSTMSDISSLSSGYDAQKAHKTQLLVRTEKILIKLEAGVSEQIPLIALNLSITGELTNWLFSPSLSIRLNLEMSYFNEAMTSWEPIIEPVEDSNEQLRPYEILIEMITNNKESEQNGILSPGKGKEAKPELEKHMNNLRALRSFQIHSDTSLQFVLTKTFMSLLDTVNKTFNANETESSIYDDKDDLEMEENMIIENLMNRKSDKKIGEEISDEVASEVQELDDDNEENYSFNFLIKNELGIDVKLESLFGFNFFNFNYDKQNDQNKVTLLNNQSHPVILRNNFMNSLKPSESAQTFDSIQTEPHDRFMQFKMTTIDNSWSPLTVNVNNSKINGYMLHSSSKTKGINTESLILCETLTILDKRRIRLRSPVQIVNTLEFSIHVSYPCSIDDSSSSTVHWTDTTIKPGKKWCLPLATLRQNKVNFFRIAPILSDDLNVEMQPINWKSSDLNKLLSFNSNKTFIQVLIEKDPVDVYSSNSDQNIDFSYNVILLPTVTFHNYLPYAVRYKIDTKDSTKCILQAGESVKLYTAKIGHSTLQLEIENYIGLTWYSSHLININTKVAKRKRQEETDQIEFRSVGKIISLSYNSVLENHCLSFTLFSPYWVMNQTQLKLEYKFKGENEINEIDENYHDLPLFLKLNCKTFTSQTKNISLRVPDKSEWSQVFLVDAIGNNGTVLCKPKSKEEKFYEIGVDIHLSSNNLTKIIKFTPYYLLVNSTDYVLDVCEIAEFNQQSLPNVVLNPNTITPFWPTHYAVNKNNSIRITPWASTENNKEETSDISSPFWYNKKHSTVLKFTEKSTTEALFVECIPTEELIRTIIKPYTYGTVPVMVVNCLKNQMLSVKQIDENDDEVFLMPNQYLLKTWKNPTGKRELNWSCGLSSDQVYNLEILQSKQKFQISLSRDAYCISFLDGLQKVLMFVDHLNNLNDEVVGFKEIKGDEFVLNLKSLSLSLIDDTKQLEIMYMSITSSSINWGEKLNNKVKVFKAFPTHQIERLEEIYQRYLIDVEENPEMQFKPYLIDESDEIDFSRMVMFTGKKEIPLQRHFAPSLYVNYFKSLNQTNLHLMIHKLQIDNQLVDCVFPVAFSKVLPPKSVASSTIVKPIIEMSMVQSHCQRTHTSQVKYFKILMQEFSVKVDIILLNTLGAFFIDNPNNSIKYIHDVNKFQKELHEVKRSFHDLFHFSLENFSNTHNEKMYFDLCHISPIKIHVSFSLSGADAFKDSNILLDNPLFKSIGLVLTDMQDVVFKLGYFEISNSAYSWKEVSSEATNHYKSQIIKQAYILVLGLDVLGNPFGLIRGLAEGVESLFYEPYAGFVQGPGEFAEGVALGIGKLFGNTLGGAAGAFSKITGTLGKGLATLSFDKDYQKNRQKKADAKPTFIQNVGQNLVMGVVSGVTGIVEKPIEGAKSGGAMGVLGGIGKGLLGVVTKPTAGIVDFTSQSFEGIRKVAVQEESVNRVRPPRKIYRLVTPYRLREAQCIMILKDLEKGMFSNQRFVTCLDISKDPKLVLIATSSSILLVKDNFVFGNQSKEWSYEYSQLRKAPELLSDGQIRISTNIVEKMIFEKNRNVEKVLRITDMAAAKKFVIKVIRTMKDRA